MTVRLFDAQEPDRFREGTLDDLAAGCPRPAWIDVIGATPGQLDRLGEIFGFHPLSVEDATKRQQRPKVDEYADHLFVVMYAIEAVESRTRPDLLELHVFLTREVIVTVHRHVIEEIEVAARRTAASR